MKDERLASKVEGKTNFSMRLKQFDGLTRLTVTLSYFTTDLRHSVSDLAQHEQGCFRASLCCDGVSWGRDPESGTVDPRETCRCHIGYKLCVKTIWARIAEQTKKRTTDRFGALRGRLVAQC